MCKAVWSSCPAVVFKSRANVRHHLVGVTVLVVIYGPPTHSFGLADWCELATHQMPSALVCLPLPPSPFRTRKDEYCNGGCCIRAHRERGTWLGFTARIFEGDLGRPRGGPSRHCLPFGWREHVQMVCHGGLEERLVVLSGIAASSMQGQGVFARRQLGQHEPVAFGDLSPGLARG